MSTSAQLSLDDATSSAAVLRLYRQAFAVLAQQAEAMVLDPASLDVDEAILDAFAEAGSEGLTQEQLAVECGHLPPRQVERRFEVLRGYGAVSKAFERANERRYRAAFAPYVMMLFLRRLSAQGGQSELHQLLTVEYLEVQKERATEPDGAESLRRLTKVFRLLANELAILAVGGVVEQLRENAQLLWGNKELLSSAEQVHETVLRRWPALDRECARLRMALAAYGDAVDAAASRLIERAGTTRALGLLPVESWISFARSAEPERLAGVLDGFVFDAPAPWFDPQEVAEAVATGRSNLGLRTPPPRGQGDLPAPGEPAVSDDTERVRQLAEEALGGRGEASVEAILGAAGDWPAARRALADLTAAHHHPDLPYELVWADGLRVDPAAGVSWVSDGVFRRSGAAV
jgi:hypothetical protein